jgi:hypothetical protein
MDRPFVLRGYSQSLGRLGSEPLQEIFQDAPQSIAQIWLKTTGKIRIPNIRRPQHARPIERARHLDPTTLSAIEIGNVRRRHMNKDMDIEPAAGWIFQYPNVMRRDIRPVTQPITGMLEKSRNERMATADLGSIQMDGDVPIERTTDADREAGSIDNTPCFILAQMTAGTGKNGRHWGSTYLFTYESSLKAKTCI